MVAIQLLCATMAQATEFEISGITYTITDAAAKTVGVTYYDDSQEISGNVVIPSSISYNGVIYNITSISDGAFSGCNGITSIEIPNSVTKIGTDAFYRCGGLKSVTIDCKNVGSWFSDSSIKEVILGNSVTTIEDGAFDGCVELTSVTIPSSVTSIGKYAFYNTGLTSIEIPSSVTSIGEYAFFNTKLTSIAIPNSVTTIEDGAFSNCAGLTHIIVENKNSTYDSREYCNAIIETATNTLIVGCINTIIPNSVIKIGTDAFYGCEGLKNIEIPNSVTTIEHGAFRVCTGLTNIEMPNNLTTIEDYAFLWCYSLTTIEIPNSVTKIGTDAFSGCEGLKSVTIDCKNVGSWFSGSSIKEFIIGNNVTTIEKGAFYSCNSLTSVTIGNRVRIIGKTAFRDCRSLTSITIPKNVTIIENYAFYNTGLTEIYSMSSSPATIDLGTFNYFSATLYVPIGAKAAYQAADYWKEFSNIVEMDFTGIDDIEAEDSFQGIKDAYYELNGRIAVSPTKGIYIRNGKKIVVE